MPYLEEMETYKGRKSRLEQLGANEEKARMLAGSRKGLCATTAFRDLNYIITNKKLEAGGYPTFEQIYAIKQRDERRHAPNSTHGAGRRTKYFND